MTGFEWEFPGYYLLFLFLIPLGYFLLKHGWAQKKNLSALAPSLNPYTPFSYFLLRASPLVILALIALALMGPRGDPHYSEGEQKEREAMQGKTPLKGTWLLVIDTSASMKTTDSLSKESRLSLAKGLADQLVAQSPQANKALFALGSTVVKEVPRTLDSLFIRIVIKQLTPGEAGLGTNFLTAFERLGKEAEPIPDPVAVILLSDGEDTEKKGEEEEIAAQFLKNAGRSIPIYAVAFGSSEGGEVPDVIYKGQKVTSRRGDALLKALARRTQGKFYVYEAENKPLLADKIIRDLNLQEESGKELWMKEAAESLIWNRYFQYPLFIALFLLVLYLTYPRAASILSIVGILLTLEGDEWQEGAALYNQALYEIQKGDLEKGEETLLTLNLAENTSPYVIEKIEQLKGVLAWLQREKEAKELNRLLLTSALYALNNAEKAHCRFERDKGYETCPPSFKIDALKRSAKGAFISDTKESNPLFLAAYGLAWIDRVKAVQKHPEYYPIYLSFLDESSPPFFREALNNFMQKDFEESLSLFENGVKTLVKEVNKMPVKERVLALLEKPFISLYDLKAMGEEEGGALYKAFLLGNFFQVRVLLAEQYYKILRDEVDLKSPHDVMSRVVLDQELVILAAEGALEFPSDSGAFGLAQLQKDIIESLPHFLSASKNFREEQFQKEGCETVPWSEIIPLYEKGSGEAIRAHKELDKGSLLLSLPYQKQAHEAFKEILKLLDSHQNKPEASQAKEALSESIRLLQDFEISDRALAPASSTPIDTERPW